MKNEQETYEETLEIKDLYEIRKVKFAEDPYPLILRYDLNKHIYYSLSTSRLNGSESDEFYQVPISLIPIVTQYNKKAKCTRFDRENTIKISYEEFNQLGGNSFDLVALQMFIDYKGICRYYKGIYII